MSSFKEIIQYISASLSRSAVLTVAGVILLRRTPGYTPEFRLPFYPWSPLVFIITTLWMIIYITIDDYRILLYTLGTLLPGMAIYFLSRQGKRFKQD